MWVLTVLAGVEYILRLRLFAGHSLNILGQKVGIIVHDVYLDPLGYHSGRGFHLKWFPPRLHWILLPQQPSQPLPRVWPRHRHLVRLVVVAK